MGKLNIHIKDTENRHPDLELAEACAAGDEMAMDTVYRTHGPLILTLCRRYASSREDALDLLHDGFIRAFEKVGDYRGEGPLGPWIKRVVLNLAISKLRKRVRWEKVDVEELADLADEEWNEPLADPETLLPLIASLPDGYRTVLNLYVFEKMSHEEIAKTLAISPVSSRTQLFKARRLLKKLWKS